MIDKAYRHIAKFVTPEQILAADLQIHPACFSEYMHPIVEVEKWKAANQKDIMHSEDDKVSIISKQDIFRYNLQIIRTEIHNIQKYII